MFYLAKLPFASHPLHPTLILQLTSRSAADGYASDAATPAASGGSTFGYRYASSGRHRTMSPPPTSLPSSASLLTNGFASLTRPSTFVSYSRTEPSVRLDTHTSTAPTTLTKVELNGSHSAPNGYRKPTTVEGGTQTTAANFKVCSKAVACVGGG